MYEKFFGFKERPFQLVPNPAYLFLSRSHEEALAHLAYALNQGDGFVEITGEVGTGKTTLCRVFLENLAKNVEAAYIFNPLLDAVQLLKAVNDEFGIDSSSDSVKSLVDDLNAFLMTKKRQGKKVILMIDEAQNLNRDVLEQLRLLSNLETNTSKLIQIILVGQPELREMLDSKELRQLGQRISVSAHLLPLVYHETRDYIHHRINIAARKVAVKFTRGAIKLIHRYSSGIPRLINIAADRALLTAYGLNKHKIDSSIAKATIRELATRGDIRRTSPAAGRRVWAAIALAGVMLAAGAYYFDSGSGENAPPVPKPSRSTSNPGKVIRKPVSQPMIPPVSKNPTKAPVSNPPVADTPKKTPPLNVAKVTPVPSAPAPAAPPKVDEPEPAKPVEPEKPATAAPSSKSEANAAPQDKTPNTRRSEQPPRKIQALPPYLATMEPTASRRGAIEAAMKLWKTPGVINTALGEIEDSWTYLRLAATQNAFSILKLQTDLGMIEKLNLPAILEFDTPQKGTVFMALARTEPRGILLSNSEETVQVAPDTLKKAWNGTAYILWKNYLGLDGIIPRNASDDAIITLKMILKDIGFDTIAINGTYDKQTRDAIRTLQEKHGIPVDGSVGPMTKIIIYNEMKSFTLPRIRQAS